MKHTKGSWVAEGPRVYINGEPKYIGKEADTLLIAAAPELLKALKHARDQLQFYADNFETETPKRVHSNVEGNLNMIEALIAKAEGGEK